MQRKKKNQNSQNAARELQQREKQKRERAGAAESEWLRGTVGADTKRRQHSQRDNSGRLSWTGFRRPEYQPAARSY